MATQQCLHECTEKGISVLLKQIPYLTGKVIVITDRNILTIETQDLVSDNTVGVEIKKNWMEHRDSIYLFGSICDDRHV